MNIFNSSSARTYRRMFKSLFDTRLSARAEKRKGWGDMVQVIEKLGSPISQKQRRFFLKS
jgi:hypothetical protein